MLLDPRSPRSSTSHEKGLTSCHVGVTCNYNLKYGHKVWNFVLLPSYSLSYSFILSKLVRKKVCYARGLTSESQWVWDAFNFLPRVLRFLGQRVVAGRDSLVMDCYHRNPQCGEEFLIFLQWTANRQNPIFSHYPRSLSATIRWPRSLRTLGTRLGCINKRLSLLLFQ